MAEGPAQGLAAVMGFDVEWVPVSRPGWAPTTGRGGEVCLLQLAGRSVSVIVDLCTWFTQSTPQPALQQESPASVTTGQVVQNSEAGGQPEGKGLGDSGSATGEEMVFASQGAVQSSGPLGDVEGFDRRAAEAALDDFLNATLFRDDVLKVPHLPRYLKPCKCFGWVVHSGMMLGIFVGRVHKLSQILVFGC